MSQLSDQRHGERSEWWRHAVIYQVYVRSFADGNGDGDGDLIGVRQRLDHLADLGVDALWLTPFYPSPMADGGYDVADYRDVDPMFGTLADFEKLVVDAHGRGLKVIVDVVPNHTSNIHPWFVEALAAAPGSPARERYIFRDGRGAAGELPPNDWESIFGGSAWSRVKGVDGTPEQWYLHLFAPEQPDLNWEHPQVRSEFEDILRFWLDRGVDGFRIDVAHGMVKAAGLPDVGRPNQISLLGNEILPYFDQDGVHEIYRGWRRILESYPGERIGVAEAWVPNSERLAMYLRPDELHQAFNFHYLLAGWSAAEFRAVITSSVQDAALVGAPCTWVLSNHDVQRHVTRYGDAALGQRRARAAALLMLALPGSAYVYQGEELGLPEVLDLPDHVLCDPVWERSGRKERGRDGCRVPLPWTTDTESYGFAPSGAKAPWLPQPAQWAQFSVEPQRGSSSSMLSLYREALRLRHSIAALGDGELWWLDECDDGVLSFARPGGFVCTVNCSPRPVTFPLHGRVVLCSTDASELILSDNTVIVPTDTAVWWSTGDVGRDVGLDVGLGVG
jgi:alpha-glucosidase